ncbi:MAG: hypothetical protein U0822_24405 [Anaerolineae bacterium]
MLSEKAAFIYALLRTPTALYPRSLFQSLFPLTDADYSPDTLTRLAAKVDEYREREAGARGQAKAFLQLVVADADNALAFLKTDPLAGWDVMETIEAYYEVVADYYVDRLNLGWTCNPPVVVDTYPPPAENEDWFAVSSVPGGPRPGYPQGVYFLRRYMMPGVAELATLHENTHHFGTGSKGKGGYYRYFDEGIANFIAYIVYYHKNGDLAPIQLYRTFLQEVNTTLYEYPNFDRILASIVHQVGMTGLYRLIRRRLDDASSVDWQDVLCQTAAGRLRVARRSSEPPDDELPPTVSELQAGAYLMVSVISYPERMLMSPATYLTYDRINREGPLPRSAIQDRWQMTADEAEAVYRELARVYLWSEIDGQIGLRAFRSDLFYGTGVMRATWEGTPP